MSGRGAAASKEQPAALDLPAWAQLQRAQLQQAQLQGRVAIPRKPSGGQHRVFINSIPPSVSEQQLVQLLLSFGALQSFSMPSESGVPHRVGVALR